MLLDEGGRFKTVRTPEEYLWLAEKDFESLEPDEFDVLKLIVEDIAAYGKSPILEMGSGSLYRTPPVNMETFLDDSYFCAKVTKKLFPTIRSDLIEVFNGRYEQALIGGSIGCIAEGTRIDTKNGKIAAGDIHKPTYYKSWNAKTSSFEYQLGTAPFPKGKGDLYRVVFEHGEFVCFGSHLVLCHDDKYRSLEELSYSLGVWSLLSPQVDFSPQLTNVGSYCSRFLSGVQHYFETVLNSKDHCSTYFHRCDRRLRQELNNDPTFVPSLIGVLKSFLFSFLRHEHKGDQKKFALRHSHHNQLYVHLSKTDFFLRKVLQGFSREDLDVLQSELQLSSISQSFQKFETWFLHHLQSLLPFFQHCFDLQVYHQSFDSPPFGPLFLSEGLDVSDDRLRFLGISQLTQKALSKFLSRQHSFLKDRSGVQNILEASLSGGIIESRIIAIEKVRTDWYWDLQVSENHNYIAEGAIHHNSGKSTFARLAMLRMVYEASCLNDPFEAYGVARSDKIAFPCISVTEEQANELVFDKIKAAVEDIPYFNNEFKPLKSTDVGGILFPNGIWIPPGLSTERRTLGINAFGSVIEEANFFKSNRSSTSMKTNSPDLAEAIYKSISRRMQSRFLVKGRLPGMIIMISSKTSVNAFTERRIKEAASNPNMFIKESAIYEVAPERYSGKKFKVAIGSETKPSRILEDHEEDPEAMKVIEVPIEFKDSFENDIDSSIREISGFATVSITPYIARRDKIYDCIDIERSHPFEPYIWSHDVAGKFIWEKIARMKKPNANSPESWEPLFYPHAPRFVSIDLSKSGDATGFAMGCLGPYVSVHRVGKDTEMVPSLHIDFALRIEAATHGEIIQSEIRSLIYQLSAHGFYIKALSADQFQSVAFLQSMRAQGYQTRVISVDTTTGPYDMLKLAIYENRISYYRYNPLIKELRELQKNWKTGKVDHPDPSEVQGASKDVSDALAQVCFQIQEASSKMHVEAPTLTDTFVLDDANDDRWILENAVAMSDPNAGHIQEDWRIAAEKRLSDSQPGQYTDWRSNFQMPFEMG